VTLRNRFSQPEVGRWPLDIKGRPTLATAGFLVTEKHHRRGTVAAVVESTA